MASSPHFYTPSLSSDDHVSPHEGQQLIDDAFLAALVIVLVFAILVLLTTMYVFCCKRLLSRLATIEDHSNGALPSANRTRNGGLSKASIALMPTFTHITPSSLRADAGAGENDASDASFECPVCLSGFQEGEQGRMLPVCRHSFHVQCIDMWFYSHSTCPLCRAQVIIPTIPPPSGSSPSSSLPTHHGQQERGQEEPQAPSNQLQITIGRTDNYMSANATHITDSNQLPSANLQQGRSPICGEPSSSSSSNHIVCLTST